MTATTLCDREPRPSRGCCAAASSSGPAFQLPDLDSWVPHCQLSMNGLLTCQHSAHQCTVLSRVLRWHVILATVR